MSIRFLYEKKKPLYQLARQAFCSIRSSIVLASVKRLFHEASEIVVIL